MNNKLITADVIIIGAGAAGLMCAIEAGKRGRKVIIIEHANKPGKKILMSGGGRCNFTNYNIEANKYISNNPNFCKSALARYTQWDFIELVKKHKLNFHEKKDGQLFCDNKAKELLDLLLAECALYNVQILLNTKVNAVNATEKSGYTINTDKYNCSAQSLVIASGGLSIPSMGATPFGYKIAEQFGLNIVPTRAGLVPLTLHDYDKIKLIKLIGVAATCQVSTIRKSFTENILFTHRGLSGPAILQISSYWNFGEDLTINFLPNYDLMQLIQEHRQYKLKNILPLPKSLIEALLPSTLHDKVAQELTATEIQKVTDLLTKYNIKPNGTEGYRTAEVTLGGVDCHQISSKTMECLAVKGLYFIGEVLDVTGWLGGFNFQWAWSSGWAAGQVV